MWYWQVLGALGVVLAVMGFNMGCIDCLANLKMIQLYGEAVAPFLQVLVWPHKLWAFFFKIYPRVGGVHLSFSLIDFDLFCYALI